MEGNGGGLKAFKREKLQANQKLPPHIPVWGVCGPQDQRAALAVGPMGSTRGGQGMAFGHANPSRAPLTFFDRIRASELRIRICFQIMNHDSLTHNEDYENLTKGWEFILDNDDEDNSTNDNAK